MSSDSYKVDQTAREAARLKTKVEGVKTHALEHYEDGGWDVIVECWEDADIIEHTAEVDTAEEAIALLQHGPVAVWADRQADARNSAF